MKVVFAFLIFSAAIFAKANAIDQVLGVITPTDSILAMTTVQRRFRLGQVVTATYTFTGASTTASVVGIRISDNKPARKSPAVAITSGALNSATVTLTLTSQRSLGINSQITVYGTP
ncbi:uncharacterized protein LOC120770249 isoform X2 [Bactrocera tryoni]|uniref:uncharacterized protein LOC120770249 isoform X2 n=1 Tax=Bactrocera tryoni TaxID=59916 RepID=UPI001A95D69C|nr:uncharacterized protein LOC120770249 isoform X2 [Bactrocera tryoni]